MLRANRFSSVRVTGLPMQHQPILEFLEGRQLFTVFVVTNAGDNRGVNPAPGAHTGTLRQAIIDSNSATGSANTINFDITSGSPLIIPQAVLPAITNAVTLDGTTQPGYDAVAPPVVELDGANAGASSNGLVINATGVTVRALIIDRFKQSGILIKGGSDNLIQGNYIGITPANAANEGNVSDGISLTNGTFGNTIGGTVPAFGNTISDNGANGIEISNAYSNDVEGNTIGSNQSRTGAAPNGTNGVLIDSGANGNVIGGNAAADGNTIAFNHAAGVAVTGNTSTGNAIRSNAIFSNIGLGIDLNADGITGDDAGDADSGPNDLQNFPFVDAVTSRATDTTVTSTLQSAANTNYVIDLYVTPSAGPGGAAQGQTLLGTVPLRTDASGAGTFSITFQQPVTPGDLITATATQTGNGDTSEFSSPAVVTTPQTAVAPDPAALYPFDETGGTKTADASGDGNNGMLVNSPTFVAAQRGDGSGNALSFNGSTQYVKANDSPTLDPTHAITLSAWINATDWNGNRRILEKGANDTQYRLTAESGVLKFDLVGVGTISAPLPSTGVWHQVTGTWDGSLMMLYVDGRAVASAMHTGTLAITSDPLVIGSKNTTSANAGNFFHGLLDNVRVDDVALSPAQVASLYTPVLIAHYKLNQSQGTTTADSTGDGNTASLVNGAALVSANRNAKSVSALSLNGTNQYARVSDSPSLDPTGGITLSAWIDATDWNGNRRILEKGANDSQYRLTAESGVLKFNLTGVGTVTTALPSTGQWHLVTGTWDGSTMTIYVDGVAQNSLKATGTIAVTSDPLVIGTKNNTTTTAGNFFSGLIGDVRIYAGALTAADVKTLYQDG